MAIHSQKLKNAIEKENPGLEYHLKNILVNGNCRGTSGFVVNPVNGMTVYVTTEESVLSSLHFMYRYADSIKDYTGYHNRWANSLNELVTGIIFLLNSPKIKTLDYRI